ncbi:hypothetical protein AB0L57_14745 [Nocardia sp. NPDC052254]|uniref:hypothetical protein n=1 Tax=Nocardia sp. NPDC052254 TaxID=3155681 RepID=UPI00343BBEA5
MIPAADGVDATRYLCAAVHFDRTLADRVIGQVLQQPLRAVATSPGVDLESVAKYAIATRRRHLTGDIVLAIVLIVLFVYLPIDRADAITGLVLPLLVVGWIVVSIEEMVARWGGGGRLLRREAFAAAAAPAVNSPVAVAQIEHVATYSDANLTVYHGYQPFLGYGAMVDAWSVALDITKAADSDEPVVPFAVAELNRRLGDRIAGLDIPGIRVRQRVFVNGTDIHDDRRLLPDPARRPPPHVGGPTIDQLMAHPEDRVRPYLVAEIIGWRGELVWSVFLRPVTTATSLFVEANYCMLPPLRQSYHAIDEMLTVADLRQVVKLWSRAVLSAPRRCLVCLPGAVRGVLAAPLNTRRVARQRRQVKRACSFDHGASLSIREAAADLRRDRDGGVVLGYHRYFQRLDEQMYSKIVEKRIFETLADFLRERNIDPAELLRRSETIINSSVSIGGDVAMQNSALGGFSAMATRIRNRSSNSAPGVAHG